MGQNRTVPTAVATAAPQIVAAQIAAPQISAPQIAAPLPAPPMPVGTAVPAPVVAAAPVIVAAPVAVAAPAPVPAPGIDLAALLLAVVAEKTGYPVEMINLDMDLEADLGVDSIKRVEILAALHTQGSLVVQTDSAKMSGMHTLRQIAEYLQGGTVASTPVAPAAAAADDIARILLGVVADKTGYPVEMLDLAMDIEADLGIDSIKRVEILAAMTERVPGIAKDSVRPSALHKHNSFSGRSK